MTNAWVVNGQNQVKAVPLSGWTLSERTGLPVETDLTPARLHHSVPAVYRCIHLRAQAVSRVPFELTSKGGGKLRGDMQFLEQRIARLLYQIEASLCLYGAAYLMRERNRAKLLDLRWLNATTMTPKFDSRAGLTGFTRTLSDGKELQLTPDDVVYVWLPDPDVEIGPGTAPIEVASKPAASILRADEYVTSFFERGGMNVTLLITDPTTSEADLQRLQTWWKRLTRGVKKAWETIALRKNVDVKQFGYSLDELAMPELKSQAVRQIANAFGVPEYYLSSDVANFATAKSYDLSFHETVVVSECNLIETTLNEQLLYPLGLAMEFHPERLEVFQEAELQKAQGLAVLVGKPILTMDEARAAIEYEPLPPESVPPRLEGMLVADVEGGVVTKNERRVRLGLEEVPEDMSEMARRQLLAQLAIVKAATDAKLTPAEGVRLALGEPLDSLLTEDSIGQSPAPSVPPGPAQPMPPVAPDGAGPTANDATMPPDGEAPGQQASGGQVEVIKALLAEVKMARALLASQEAA